MKHKFLSVVLLPLLLTSCKSTGASSSQGLIHPLQEKLGTEDFSDSVVTLHYRKWLAPDQKASRYIAIDPVVLTGKDREALIQLDDAIRKNSYSEEQEPCVGNEYLGDYKITFSSEKNGFSRTLVLGGDMFEALLMDDELEKANPGAFFSYPILTYGVPSPVKDSELNSLYDSLFAIVANKPSLPSND